MSGVNDSEFFTIFNFRKREAVEAAKPLDEIFRISSRVPNDLYGEVYVDLVKSVTVYGWPDDDAVERATSEFIGSVLRTITFYLAKKRRNKVGRVRTGIEKAVEWTTKVMRSVVKKDLNGLAWTQMEEEECKYTGKIDFTIYNYVTNKEVDDTFLMIKCKRSSPDAAVKQCCLYLKRMAELNVSREVKKFLRILSLIYIFFFFFFIRSTTESAAA